MTELYEVKKIFTHSSENTSNDHERRPSKFIVLKRYASYDISSKC